MLQSLLAVVCVMAFVALGRDPLLELFTWLSYVAAVGVVLLMLVCSIAVIGYFRNGRDAFVNAWQRLVAPLLATVSLGAILAILVMNSDAILGAEKGSMLTYILPGLVLGAAILGLLWGLIIKMTRPQVYAGIGRGTGEDDDEDSGGPAGPRFTQTDTDARGLRV